jgi:hypothetical protein
MIFERMYRSQHIKGVKATMTFIGAPEGVKGVKGVKVWFIFFGSAFGALMHSELIFAFRRTIRRVNPFVGGVTCGNYRVVVAPVWVVRARHCREKGQTVPSFGDFCDFLKPDHRAPKNPLRKLNAER